ncbi:MAG: SDR family NAD(P)-dependent oxidoreductase [Candidatus Aenigmarchaeota archaeon]|nr:SDR family NAD(P)-dependent oxidoreductase [Candidatus Aenigmarchaeota archaeon]
MELKGKTALITGASKGLGKEIALRFASEGCNLILNSRGKDSLERVAEECKRMCIFCETFAGDITENRTIDSLSEISKRKGLDILFNNAGMIIIQPSEKNTDKEMRDIFALNVLAHINLTQKLIPLLKERGEAQIVNIISNSGLEGRPNMSLYCSTKFALRGYTDSLRKEVNKHGIKVLGVYPGGIRTNLFDEIKDYNMSGFMDPKEVAQIIVDACKLSKGASVDDIVVNRTNK